MKRILLTFYCLFGFTAASYALTSDRDQPISIEADSAFIDEVKGETIYEGNAIIRQGTLNITADKVRVIMTDNEVVQIIASMAVGAEGLAHYEQQPDDDEALVSADAKTINYFIQEERLHLTGNAILQQTLDRFAGELLYYDMTTGVVELKSGKSSEDKVGRVSITLQPKKKSP
ncbi:MAG: lipopolysaccharide transport periplasmic protein LptA [Pseudomonadales bacterium]